MTRVSVVLPTYNRDSVLEGAIESVLAQSYADLELIVVDGGSTDGTRAVVESFADSRINYLRRDDPEGPSAARNAGIRAAEGDAVAFIDSDDRWRVDKLETQVAELEPHSVVYTAITKDYGQPLHRGGETGEVSDAVRRMAVPTYTSTLLVTPEAFEHCGGFDESLPCFEDWELCLRLAREYTFSYVDEPLVVKGTGGDNTSADPDRLAAAIRHLGREYDLPDGTWARLLADAGVTYCEAGRFREGRPYLRRSLRHDPYQANTAAALCLSLSGSSAVFDALMDRVYMAERLAGRLG